MGRAVRLEDRVLRIGSGASNDLVLTDPRVSRAHLRIGPAERAGEYKVHDLGSRNGTLYAGSRITEAVVPVGASLKVGHSFLRIQPLPEPLEVAPSQARRFGELVAESLAMRELFAVLELAARSDVTVLLEGETGTGKELAARALHDASARRRGAFVAVDCGALPESLLESELFGHTRGAFTGASRSRRGAFTRAHGGTIFLDELDGVPPPVQARLLRVVEERKVRPVGADQEHDIDVRIVAASRASLPARVAEGAFRPDLFYRLSVIRVELPPLRARREDIPMIVAELLRLRGFSDIRSADIGGPNLERLVAHDWPGNVRELRNIIDRSVALSPGVARFDALRLRVGPGLGAAEEDSASIRTDLPYAEAKRRVLEAFERRYLTDVFARAGGNISEAARASGVDRKHLRTLLRRHGLIDP